MKIKHSTFPDCNTGESCVFGVTGICARVLIYKGGWVTTRRGHCCWKNFLTYISQEEGHTTPHRATGRAQGLVRRWKDQGESMAQNLHCVFHGTGKAGQGNSLGLASWVIWAGSGLQVQSLTVGTWPWATWPWVTWRRGNTGSVCED